MTKLNVLLLVPLAGALLAATATAKPKVFSASPDSMGLLVVEFRVQHGWTWPVDVGQGTVLAADSSDHQGRHFDGTATSGHLVFAVPPGRYRLESASARAMSQPMAWMRGGKLDTPGHMTNIRYDERTLQFGADSLANLMAEVRRGAVSYLGTVDVDWLKQMFAKDQFHIRLRQDPKHQASVLRDIGSKAKGTAWADPALWRETPRDSTAVGSGR